MYRLCLKLSGFDVDFLFYLQLSGQLNPIKILQLVTDVPGAHAPAIQGNHLILNTGDIALVFRDKHRFKFPVTVPGHFRLEFPILALYGFGSCKMSLKLSFSRE